MLRKTLSITKTILINCFTFFFVLTILSVMGQGGSWKPLDEPMHNVHLPKTEGENIDNNQFTKNQKGDDQYSFMVKNANTGGTNNDIVSHFREAKWRTAPQDL